jgi:hypothetical protein
MGWAMLVAMGGGLTSSNYWKMLTAGTGVGLVSSIFIIFVSLLKCGDT